MQRQAERRKFHYIYKTTCLVTNRYYIGMHSTDDLEDGYIGSGQRLWRSIKKHGRENHRCEVVEFVDSREELRNREREIVNEEMLKDSQCLNLKIGGEGGWSKEAALRGRVNANKSAVMRKISSETLSKTLKRLHVEGRFKYDTFTGKSHTEEVKALIGAKNSVHQTGSGNSQFGKLWIYSETEKVSKKISKDEVEVHLSNGWKLGRRIKW